MSDKLIERISYLQNADHLSTWEIDFLESVELRVKAGQQLSERQLSTLEQMEERHA